MKLLVLLGLVAVGTNAGQYAWYTYNERLNGGRCKNIDQCDGQRTCSGGGLCQGN